MKRGWHALAAKIERSRQFGRPERTRSEKSRNRISTLVFLYLA
jgi:hypothetical protein